MAGTPGVVPESVLRPRVHGVDVTRLRPAREGEAALVADEDSALEDFSGDETLPRPPGLEQLCVVDDRDAVIGLVQWHPVRYGRTRRSVAYNVGISLLPRVRGGGHGARAQRLLAQHLFSISDVQRVEAGTDVENIAEQRALERAGFQREGTLRDAQWRGGRWHDLIMYAMLREEAKTGDCRTV